MSEATTDTRREYACRACGWSETNNAAWCDLGCGRDYNEMVALPAPVARQLRALVAERDRAVEKNEILSDALMGLRDMAYERVMGHVGNDELARTVEAASRTLAALAGDGRG